MPWQKRPSNRRLLIPGYEDVEAGIVKWPLSVIRIRSPRMLSRLIDLADHILTVPGGTTQMKRHLFSPRQTGSLTTPSPPLPECGTTTLSWIWLCETTSPPKNVLWGVYHPHAKIPSYQERKHRTYRSDGTGHPSCPPKRRAPPSGRIYSGEKRYPLPAKPLKSTQTGQNPSCPIIRISARKISRKSSARKSEKSLPVFWKMPVFTNVLPKEERPSCVFFPLCNVQKQAPKQDFCSDA